MKTCVLCPDKIAPRYTLCKSCYARHGIYIETAWFKELRRLQARQDTIDARESYFIPASIRTTMQGAIEATTVSSKKPIGRPATDHKLVEEVLRLFDESRARGEKISLRKIEALLNNRVKFLTVRNILLTYRKKEYQQ